MGSGLWLPSSVEAPRPNRKARRAQQKLAEAKQFANVQRPAGLPAHLPPPQVKVGWNDENVVLVMVFGPNEVPLPFEPKGARLLAAALVAAAGQVDKLNQPEDDGPLSPEAEQLLAEAKQNLADKTDGPNILGPIEQYEYVTEEAPVQEARFRADPDFIEDCFSFSTDGIPIPAEAVADSPAD
jgi:hypothetical protein